METLDSNKIHAEFLLRDAADRLRFQHEFSIAGFKTLILINGGAIIALLTYIGNSSSTAGVFVYTFAGYAVGLVIATLAYLFAYESQSEFMLHSNHYGIRLLGLETNGDPDDNYKKGSRYVGIARILCIISLMGFVIGSIAAMFALG